MAPKFPVDQAALAIVERQIRADMTAAHLVLWQAVALLIADLHAQGAVDGDALAGRLATMLSAPDVAAQAPRAQALAEDLAALIRGAVRPGAPSV